MILFYTLVLFLLVAVKCVTARRAASLERKFSRIALTAEKLIREPVYRAGNGGLMDPYQVAKRQFQLGLLIQKRDRLEGKCMTWQKLAESMERMVASVRGYSGRKLPYTFGALDVSMLLALIDTFGVGEVVSVRNLLQLVTGLWTN